MTGSELYDFVTELLGGREFEGSDDIFYQILNEERTKIEHLRPWAVLRKEDSSITVSASNTYTDMKTLPTDFRSFWGPTDSSGRRKYIELVSGNDVRPVYQVPFGMQRQYKDTPDRFYADHGNSQIGFCGTYDKTYTAYITYIGRGTDIESSTSWAFPSEYHPLLAGRVAARNKGEIDYDDINARMVQYHGASIEGSLRSMIRWDDELQRNERNL